MQVRCIANRGTALSLTAIRAGHTRETRFDIAIGEVHTVYAVSLWQGTVNYLIALFEDFPDWYPAELFEITDYRLPPNWFFKFFGYDDARGLTAIWGYKELATNYDYY